MQHPAKVAFAAVLLAAAALQARADVVIDWNIRANDIIVESKMGTPPAMRAMAIVQTAVYEAVKNAAPGASLDAAVAAANRVTLAKLFPAQQTTIEIAWQNAITALPSDGARAAGIEAEALGAVHALYFLSSAPILSSWARSRRARALRNRQDNGRRISPCSTGRPAGRLNAIPTS